MKYLITILLVLATITASAQKVIDKKFIAVHTIYALSSAADFYTTANVLDNCPRCTEQNLLLGKRPSTAHLVIHSSVEFTSVTLLDYVLKKKYPNTPVWLVMPAVFTTGHGIGFAVNIGNIRSIRHNEWMRH